MRLWAWVMFSAAGTTVGCATAALPVAAYRPVDAPDRGADWRRMTFEDRHGGRVNDPRVADVARVAKALGAARSRGPAIEVGVLATAEPNAFVLANGHVYVTRGMLGIICDDDELASVVAHELAHLDDLSAFDGSGLGGDEKLRIEADADGRAVGLLLDAAFDPTALGRMIDRLSDEQPAGWAAYRCNRLAERVGR